MDQGRPAHATLSPAAPRVAYVQATAQALLAQPGTLAVLDFAPRADHSDPRLLPVPLPHPGPQAPGWLECWQVAGPVEHGRDGDLGWARSGEWMFAHVVVDEADHGHDIGQAAQYAYRRLCGFLGNQRLCHVQRVWNYLDAINEGDGDAERYKHFCSGRLQGMGDYFDADGYPAATAVGFPEPTGKLVVYCLASAGPGRRIENPRQVSAWRYPRQYGRTPPSFARAMVLPAADVLAISGTAAITGHQSRHREDLEAQLTELKANLDSLLDNADMPAGFDGKAPLKVYIRHREDAPMVAAFLDQHMPGAPHVLLQGDICRQELLVEIDGWRYA